MIVFKKISQNKIMKNKILIFLLLTSFFNISLLYGQELTVSDQVIEYDNQERSCIKVFLKPGTKTVKKAYKDWMDDKQDVDVDGFGFLKNKDVLKAEKATIKAISPYRMDMYARIVEKDDYTEMSVFGSMGYDLYLTPQVYPSEYRKMKGLVFSFLNDFLPGYYQEKVEETKDVIGDIKDDKMDAKDDLADNREEIEDLKKENKELIDKIKEYENQLAKENSKLSDQNAEKEAVIKMIKKDKR